MTVAGGSAISPKLSDRAPAALCGWPAGSLWKADIPPMLAAAICLSFRALAKLLLKIWPTNLEMNQILKITAFSSIKVG